MLHKLKKLGALAGVVSVLAMVAPGVASAHGQLLFRSATVGTSRQDAYSSVAFQWNAGTSATVRTIRIQICGTPNYTDACTAATGESMASTTLASTGGQLGASGWVLSHPDGTSVLLTNTTGVALTAGTTDTIGLLNVRNATADNTTVYYRATTYSTTAALVADEVDFGSTASFVDKTITVVGEVGETLVFHVANEVSSACTSDTDVADPNDTTEDLVTLAPQPIGLGGPSYSTAQFCFVSNALDGIVVQYKDEGGYLGNGTQGFWNGAHEFGTAPSGTVSSGHASIANGDYTQFASTAGVEQFGFNLRDNATPDVGLNPSGAGSQLDISTNYSVADAFSYDDSGNAVTLVTHAGPSTSAVYTLSYVANINSLTPGGTYQAHQVFVATATF